MRSWRGAVALVVLCMAPAVMAPSVRAATLPPNLVMLSQKLAQLKASSLRFSIELAITAAHGAKPPKRLVIVAASGEAGGSPVRAKVNVTTLGQHDSVRTIGGISYEYRPEIARLDGGRPWIRQRLSPSEHPKASSHLTLLELTEIPISLVQNRHASLAEVLNEAQSAVEVGPTTVDGQQVTQFNATLNPEPPVMQVSSPRPTLAECSRTSPRGKLRPSLIPRERSHWNSSSPPAGFRCAVA